VIDLILNHERRLGTVLKIGLVAGLTLGYHGTCVANEILTDRCSGDVAIVPGYNSRPDNANTIILRRDSRASTVWTKPFTVNLSSEGRIRWYCHSTTGNWIDIGTWRIEELSLGTSCDVDANFQHPSNCQANGRSLKLTLADTNGWTAERSRCNDHSTVLRAHLGPDRLFQMECLGNDQRIAQNLSTWPPASPTLCYDTIQNTIAWDYNGSKQWDPANVNSLCSGAEDTREPAWCFLHTMFGGVDWGEEPTGIGAMPSTSAEALLTPIARSLALSRRSRRALDG
jgi:hypothetical protein